jgi:hypothetical protein
MSHITLKLPLMKVWDCVESPETILMTTFFRDEKGFPYRNNGRFGITRGQTLSPLANPVVFHREYSDDAVHSVKGYVTLWRVQGPPPPTISPSPGSGTSAAAAGAAFGGIVARALQAFIRWGLLVYNWDLEYHI